MLKINLSARQREESKKSVQTAKQQIGNQSKKTSKKTATLFASIKLLQAGKQRRENAERQKKNIINGK